jgi:hypothetical protein
MPVNPSGTAMVNFGLLRLVAYLGAFITLVVAMYRIYLKASPESKHQPTLSMRAAPSLAKATGE